MHKLKNIIPFTLSNVTLSSRGLKWTVELIIVIILTQINNPPAGTEGLSNWLLSISGVLVSGQLHTQGYPFNADVLV